METKSYLIEEHVDTIFESTEIDKWKELVDELGLEKQAELIKEDKSPVPFPVMTELQSSVYGALFERKEDYKRFNGEAIPLVVLSMIALCEREHYFDKIEIWYSRQKEDPLVVGKTFRSESDRENDYTWQMNSSLIAQWGPKIKSMTELLPLYDEYEKQRLEGDYKKNLQSHTEKMNKFRFQAEAMK